MSSHQVATKADPMEPIPRKRAKSSSDGILGVVGSQGLKGRVCPSSSTKAKPLGRKNRVGASSSGPEQTQGGGKAL